MEKHICKKMVEDGLMADVITISIEGEDIIAHIGEYSFTCGVGLANHPKQVSLVDLIFDTLEDFYKFPDTFDTEYVYYYYYLCEHI